MGDQDPMDKDSCAFGHMDISDDDAVMPIIAFLMNNVSKNRKYPAFWI